ncbi:MAG: electron transfer flavoprotein-ubiquinone oxidoreductase [Gammaproteobacteria bacterium]|nr:MAG: electron transfer flavoprotein-ubiquinone oxidoreductase [Gammaproteobacteria bacterium]
MSERESMEFDVVIVGGGPCGLAAACRLMQLAAEAGREIGVALVEKGAEIGAHVMSGAVLEPTALDELFPDWRAGDAPVTTAVTEDDFFLLSGATASWPIPELFVPRPARNEGNFIISLGELCRWLARQAEALGVNLFPGFAATDVIYDGERVAGIATGDMGRDRAGTPKDSFQPGYELRARQTIFAEGCRGSLGKQLMRRFDLRRDCDPQHFGIGLKEVWTIDAANHREGAVVHTLGWPLANDTEGGGFLYHAAGNQVYLGFIVALSYSNPWLDPFQEFQRWKQHPRIRAVLANGKRVSYGARAVNKGGLQSLPRLGFPGGVLAGCEAGFLNGAKIKGIHTAMKTGMIAAEAVFAGLEAGGTDAQDRLAEDFERRVRESWVYRELENTRNFGPAQHRFGTLLGAAFVWFDQNIAFGRLPFTLHNPVPDHIGLRRAADCEPIRYPKPDGVVSFDRLSSVFLSSTNHEENQPCHLRLGDPQIPVRHNLPLYAEPAQRYCPAGVYEIVEEQSGPRLQINAQNCVHCKTCDIKDPAQNIDWVPPEGGGGPNYTAM